MSQTAAKPKPQQPDEHPLANLLFNVALPAIALTQIPKRGWFGEASPTWALCLALAMPLIYGIWHFNKKREVNFLSVLGFFASLLNGSFGLLELDPIWFATKELSVPALIGIGFLASHKWGQPLIRTFLWSPQIFKTDLVDEAVATQGKQAGFNRILFRASLIGCLAFIASGVASFFLALYLLEGTRPDTPEYVEGIGKVTWVSFLALGLPLVAVMGFSLWQLVKGIEGLVGLTWDDIVHGEAKSVRVEKGKVEDSASSSPPAPGPAAGGEA